MPKIAEQGAFNGANERISRLGLDPVWNELLEVLTKFDLFVEEKRDANGAAAVRRKFDERFEAAGGWTKKQTAGADWTKCRKVDGARVCMAVEIQFSGRSDLLIVDVSHLKEAIQSGQIDVGVIVVPADPLAHYLTDRVASYRDALTAVRRGEAEKYPLIVLGLLHDGPGQALVKERTRQGRKAL